MEEQLIELVRNEAILYDTSHADYIKKTLKDTIWERIAKDINMKDGATAKAMWFKLRNCHRDALRRKVTKSGSAATTAKKWRFEDQMNFLVPFMANRQTSGNLVDETESQPDIEPSYNLVEASIRVYEEVPELETSQTQPIEENRDLEDAEEDPYIVHTPTNGNRTTGKRKAQSGVDDLLLKSLQKHEEQAKERMLARKNSDTEDELHTFFMAMYKATKKMPLVNQLRVKKKLFNSVSDEEELLLAATSTNDCD